MARSKDQTEDQPAEPVDDDPRHIARADELARQQEVIDAVNEANAAHAQTVVASEPNDQA
jgi:hypothetical protein